MLALFAGNCAPAAKSSAAAVAVGGGGSGGSGEYEEEFPELSARLANFNLEQPSVSHQQAAC